MPAEEGLGAAPSGLAPSGLAGRLPWLLSDLSYFRPIDNVKRANDPNSHPFDNPRSAARGGARGAADTMGGGADRRRGGARRAGGSAGRAGWPDANFVGGPQPLSAVPRRARFPAPYRQRARPQHSRLGTGAGAAERRPRLGAQHGEPPLHRSGGPRQRTLHPR